VTYRCNCFKSEKCLASRTTTGERKRTQQVLYCQCPMQVTLVKEKNENFYRVEETSLNLVHNHAPIYKRSSPAIKNALSTEQLLFIEQHVR